MHRAWIMLLAVFFVAGCGQAPEPADSGNPKTSPASTATNKAEAKPDSDKTATPENSATPAKTTTEATAKTKTNPAEKGTAVSGSPIGIWKHKRPEESFFLIKEELLSQALEIKADGWFMFTYLTKGGKLYEYEGKWKKLTETDVDLSSKYFGRDDAGIFPGKLLAAETFEIHFPRGRKAQFVRATTDTVDYPATSAEQQKYIGTWKANESSSRDILSETQTLNADGTAIYDVNQLSGVIYKLPGTWKLVSPDIVVITRQNPAKPEIQYFKCIGKLIDKETLDLERVTTNTIFKRQ